MNYSDEMLEDAARRLRIQRFERALGFHPNLAAWARHYGSTQALIKLLLLEQDVNCAICGQSLEDRPWDIDHKDTALGPLTRGLLCRRCNRSLLRDWEHLIPDAARYIADTPYSKMLKTLEIVKSQPSNSPTEIGRASCRERVCLYV